MTGIKTSLILIGLALSTCACVPSLDNRDETFDTRSINELVKQHYVTEHEPGLALMVVRNGDIIFQITRGIANLDTGDGITAQSNFRLASITKHITALAVLMLSDWGKLDLDASLVKMFPGFPTFGENITPRMLIHHTSGLLAYESLIDAEEYKPSTGNEQIKQVVDADVLALIKKTDRTYFEPGTEWRYSNTGYALLALLVEQASGVGFPHFLKQNIFDPLGMNNTLAYAHDNIEVPHRVYGHSRTEKGWKVTDQSPTSAVLGDGGVYSSLVDLKKWFEFLDGKNTLKLSERAYEVYLSPGVFCDGSALVLEQDPKVSDTNQPLRNRSYGYGWFFADFAGIPIYYHDGSTMGFRHMLARKGDERLYVILLTNRNEINEEFVTGILEQILTPKH
jgi:CubicO group peptidase (beta-lactamase class C family)